MVFFFLCFFFVVFATNNDHFECSFRLTQPQFDPNAYMEGVITFDYATNRVKREIMQGGSAVVTDFWQYSKSRGYLDTVGQYHQSGHRDAQQCADVTLLTAMPILFADPRYNVASDTGSTLKPLAKNPVTFLSTIEGELDSAVIGRDRYQFSDCKKKTGELGTFRVSYYEGPCPSCNLALDVVFAVDTSASVRTTVPELSKFIKDLSSGYSLSKDQVNIGIVRFNWRSWTSSPLAKGTSLQAISYPSDYPCAGGSSRDYFCYGTCVSCGIRQAVTALKGGRDGVKKAIIVVTDGFHNLGWTADNAQDGAWGQRTSAGLCPDSPANQKPNGKKYANCHPNMIADLEAAKAHVSSSFPGTEIFVYGQFRAGINKVVTARGPHESYLKATATSLDNVFLSTGSWDDLAVQTSSLAESVCGASNPIMKSCQGCCGFCAFGQCMVPNGVTSAACPPSLNSATETVVISDTAENSDLTQTQAEQQEQQEEQQDPSTQSIDAGVPGWAIALLVLFSILLVGIIVFGVVVMASRD